jgi:hypothetical protein
VKKQAMYKIVTVPSKPQPNIFSIHFLFIFQLFEAGEQK